MHLLQGLGTCKLIQVSPDNLKIDVNLQGHFLKTEVISQSMWKKHYFQILFIFDVQKCFFDMVLWI